MSSTPKVILVTGCSKGGIGFHLCEEFAEKGCIVYATTRKVESMEGFTYSTIRRLQLDVTDEKSVKSAVDTVIAEEGRIDMLVNNAGVECTGPIIDVEIDQVKQTFDANVFGVLRTARTVIPHMASRKQGLVVNIGSIAGEIPGPWGAIYGASKAAVVYITEVLQMECKPLGVSVMLVAPGPVKSNIVTNYEKAFSLPPDSLYKDFTEPIIRRLHISQGSDTMLTDEFARRTVARILAPGGPPRYIALGGGGMTALRILQWLPRRLMLWLVWKKLSAK